MKLGIKMLCGNTNLTAQKNLENGSHFFNDIIRTLKKYTVKREKSRNIFSSKRSFLFWVQFLRAKRKV